MGEFEPPAAVRSSPPRRLSHSLQRTPKTRHRAALAMVRCAAVTHLQPKGAHRVSRHRAASNEPLNDAIGPVREAREDRRGHIWEGVQSAREEHRQDRGAEKDATGGLLRPPARASHPTELAPPALRPFLKHSPLHQLAQLDRRLHACRWKRRACHRLRCGRCRCCRC